MLTITISSNFNLFFCSSFVDEYSLFLSYMLFFVILCSFVYSYNLTPQRHVSLVLVLILLFCYFMFSTTSLFFMYLAYEGSLLPILYIIVKWGSYPERSLSAIILLIYTSFFTFPFIYILFFWFYSFGSFNFHFITLSIFDSLPLFFTFLSFMTFAVKLPVYGVHFWLPIAHVEAPTFGSMILAGVLLKLGGVGLLRLSPILSLSLLSTLLLSYLLVGLSLVTLICCFQSDLKRLVAYSSVSHIIAIPLLLLSNSSLAFKSSVILMLFHGLSSPLLFICVGTIYSMFSTRQIVILRGLILFSPLFSFILILSFVFTMSTPPFPSYLAEVLFLMLTYSLTPYSILPIILFTFFSLVYNLNWLSYLTFFRPSPLASPSSYISYSSFFPIVFSLLVCFPCLYFISFF